MNITLSHGTYNDCEVKLGEYSNGRPALIIYHQNDVLLKASVNMADYIIPEGHICIKDWSENEGIMEILISHNIISEPIAFISSGYVTVNICKLLIECEETLYE